MSQTIWFGDSVKVLKPNLILKDSDVKIITNDNDDPTVTAKNAARGSLYIRKSTGAFYQKQDNGISTNWAQLLSAGGSASFGNLSLSGNTIASTNTNGNIILDPNGAGQVTLPDLTASRPLKLTASNEITATQIDLASANDVTGVLDETNGGTGQSTITTGDILYGSAANTLSKLPIGTNGDYMTITAGVPAWTSVVPGAPVAPTVQRFTSGSGTYTTPVGVLYIKVSLVGGGGGGTGNFSTGGNGSNTTFGASLLTAGFGFGDIGSGSAGGAGGTNTVNAPAITLISVAGEGGSAGQNILGAGGGNGGSSFFGGAGRGGGDIGPLLAGEDAQPNSGSGGGGIGSAAGGSGSGGGAGGYIQAIITSPAASYPYTVGSGGAAGGGSPSGGAGGAGIVIVEEYYQ